MYYFSIMEDNELSFIELFAQKIIVSRYVTLYYNSVMHDDDFFNRIVVKEFNANAIEDIVKAEEILKSKGVTPFIYSMVKSIKEYGYSLYDELITLFNNDKTGLVDNNITVRDVNEDEDVSIWIDVFSNSFDISHYRDEIKERVTRAINTNNRLILRLAYKENYGNNSSSNKPIGCSALFLTSGVIGLYCLGVLPDYRKRGVAGSLIRNALLEARSRGLMLIVQTFARDNLVPFYSKHGFTYAYSKFIYCNIERYKQSK